MSSVTQLLNSTADRISARTRIAVGQVLLLVGVMLLAVTLGVVPNEHRAVMAGRSQFCEAAAVACSADVRSGNIEKLIDTVEPILARDSQIVWAEVRRRGGRVVARFDPGHSQNHGAGADVQVPIWANDHQWGVLDVRYRPDVLPGVWGYLLGAQARLIAFVSMLCLLAYLIFLRKMLQHLDPSKVVPPRVRSALDTLAEGLIVLDTEQRIVLANAAFASIVGKSPDALMGTRVEHLPWQIQPGATPDQSAPWLEAARPQPAEAPRGVMMRLRDCSGAVRVFSVNCAPVLGHEGKIRGVLVSLDDVTQLEHNEIELRKSKEEAEHANQAKSDFLARMSHEIRTPMNAILGFADILRRGYEENPAERQEFLETIHSSGQHLLELINDVLDLSKIEAGRLEIETGDCSPGELISQVIAVLSVRAKQKAIGLDFRWDGPAPARIRTDATRLRQALTNLIGNAVKFTQIGGVQIVAQLSRGKPDAMLFISVKDSGIGIRGDEMGRIFQPFVQADTSITRRFGGTGLGLSISRQIARALGGDITVASEFGKGTTFTLSVNAGAVDESAPAPVFATDSAAEGAASRAGAHASAVSLLGVRVLAAEDGASNRKLISLVLKRAGATIDLAEDGRAAVDLATQRAYGVILMDMQMPVMDGYTAAGLLRAKGLATPIIAMTAHAMRGDEEKCRAAGCSGFLSKPIDMDLLVATVARAAGEIKRSSPATAAPAASPSDSRASAASPARTTLAPPSRNLLQSTLPTDDPEFRQIVEEFVERLHAQIGAITQAWAEGDLDELAALAHWVKGSGGTAGFAALTEPAIQLEQATRQNRLDDIAAAVSELQNVASRVAAPATADSSSIAGQPMSL